MDYLLIGLEPRANLSHMYEFVTIVPVSLYFLSHLWTLSNSSSKSNVDVSEETSFTMKIWSIFLFLSLVLSLIHGETISPIVFLTSFTLILSGLVVSYTQGQKIFHVAASCSWIGCFDMYIRTIPQTNFGHFLCWKWLVVFVMATSAVMRGHLSNKWQFASLPHTSVGVPLILLYYWGFEMPVCDMLGDTALLSCDFSHGPPPRLASCGLDDHYRILGLVSIIVIHFFYGQVIAMCFVDDCREDRSASELERGGGEDVAKYGAYGAEPIVKSDLSDKDSLPNFLDSASHMTKRSLPDDLVEISEEEAFDIVQKGLLNFKTKRAN